MKKLNELPHLSTLIHQFRVLEKEPLLLSGIGEVTTSELHLLNEIGQGDGTTAKELSQRLMITKGGISQLVQTLERKKLLQKQPSLADRRVIYLTLTPEGQVVYDTHLQTRETFVTRLTGALDQAELAAFIRGLSMLTDFNDELIQQRKEWHDER